MLSNIILVDSIPFSSTIQNWYIQNKHLASPVFNWEDSITVFKESVKSIDDEPILLRNMNCGEFYKFLWDVMNIADGIAARQHISMKISCLQLSEEIEKIKKTVMYWAIFEGFDSNAFGELDELMIDRVKNRTNKKFHYKCYYIMKNIDEKYLDLKKTLTSLSINEVQDRVCDIYDREKQENKTRLSKLIGMIRVAYKGDLESFILETMNRVQYFAMNKNHEKLAQMVRFELLDIPNFEETLPEFEIWRFIQSNYFDGFEDIFDEFVDEFVTECLEYYINDYLNESFGIIKIPFYYGYIQQKKDLKIYDSIISLLNINSMEKRQRDLYKSN